ncbi:MAG: hypothetical protein WC543_00025 [Candidatus Omnitrophota bacterium]
MCKNKKFFILSLLTLCGVLGFTIFAFAGASISITGDAWNIGQTCASCYSESARPAWVITNDSGGNQDLIVRASSTGTWAATSVEPSINQFQISYNGTGFIGSTNSRLVSGAWLSYPLWLRFKAPPAGSEEGEHTITLTLTAVNWQAYTCGEDISIYHSAANGVAPEDKYTQYYTVLSDLSGENKCWITSNLGASYGAPVLVTDDTENCAGWYWQFNRKQGYKHDGTTRTPSSAWLDFTSEDSDWVAENDPCTIELGTGWRLPTAAEWRSCDTDWSAANDAYSSVLKLHYAGVLNSGNLLDRGTVAGYWSSSQSDEGFAEALAMDLGGEGVLVTTVYKSYATPVRCIKD